MTGIVPDVFAIAEALHEYGFSACFDYAGSGAYVDIVRAATLASRRAPLARQ